jgi:hypothetical protein
MSDWTNSSPPSGVLIRYGIESVEMKIFFATLVFFVLVALCRPSFAGPKQQVVVVNGPTVIAFFPPVTEAELDKEPDTNEALADFQVYAARVHEQSHDAGFNFVEIYASSFVVKCGAKTTVFRPKKIQIGYYFVAPGKRPRVEYGVMADMGILQIASEYFRLHPR